MLNDGLVILWMRVFLGEKWRLKDYQVEEEEWKSGESESESNK